VTADEGAAYGAAILAPSAFDSANGGCGVDALVRGAAETSLSPTSCTDERAIRCVQAIYPALQHIQMHAAVAGARRASTWLHRAESVRRVHV